jgi:formate dehydrogenase subunit delta
MDIGNLVRMANNIGDFFDAMPDRQEALEAAATHLQKTWEPRMRTALLDFLAQHKNGQSDSIELHPFMRDAIHLYAERLQPAQAASV